VRRNPPQALGLGLSIIGQPSPAFTALAGYKACKVLIFAKILHASNPPYELYELTITLPRL
jgi:hypothetical protein